MTRAVLGLTCCVATVAAQSMYQNPVVMADAPDPGVAWSPEDNLWYSATTGSDPKNTGYFMIRSSPNLANWTDIGPAYPYASAPKWGSNSFWVSCGRVI